jgi:hypothetical protein
MKGKSRLETNERRMGRASEHEVLGVSFSVFHLRSSAYICGKYRL